MNWIQRLFLTPKEPEKCLTCEALREQLDYQRKIYDDLQETMISLLKPIPIIREGVNPNPKPISTAGKLWSRRRHELEKQDRAVARTMATSPVIAKSDEEIKAEQKPVEEPSNHNVVTPTPPPKTVEQLEMELGVVDGEEVH